MEIVVEIRCCGTGISHLSQSISRGRVGGLVGVPADGLLQLGAGRLQLLLEELRCTAPRGSRCACGRTGSRPSQETLGRAVLGTFKREITSAVFIPCPLLSPPLAPKYVRIPNVFTSALNTRLNTRIYLPTPAYFTCRILTQ